MVLSDIALLCLAGLARFRSSANLDFPPNAGDCLGVPDHCVEAGFGVVERLALLWSTANNPAVPGGVTGKLKAGGGFR